MINENLLSNGSTKELKYLHLLPLLLLHIIRTFVSQSRVNSLIENLTFTFDIILKIRLMNSNCLWFG